MQKAIMLTWLLTWVLAGVCGAVAPAMAGECKEGARATVSGKVTKVFLNDAGTITMDVAGTKPCHVDAVTIEKKRPPARCKAGTTFEATGKVEEFLSVLLYAERLTCGR